MLAPTFLHFGAAISRTSSRALSPLLFPRRFPPKLISTINCSYSTAVDSSGSGGGGVDAPQPHSSLIRHPWPEWISFVDGLKTKGYLIEPPSEDADGETGSDAATPYETDYCDMNILKDACLSFARDRCDIFMSLSTDDIQTVVKDGCPNLFRKVVNSAKRLRVYVQLDEGDVCSTCKLRGSCDRAYVLLKEPEATGRTLDIARLLLTYALDPLVLSGGDKPLGREHIEVSVRKLLCELSELSETPIASAAVKADTKTPPKNEKPSKFSNGALSKDVEMKKGDWMCTKCNFLNFSRNKRCLKCREVAPKRVPANNIEMKNGDWICPECKILNFSRNKRCLKCSEDAPKRVPVNDIEMTNGDWICPECKYMNFSRNRRCLKCETDGPKNVNGGEIEMKKGDWVCSKCEFMNFASKKYCLRCQERRPKRELNPGEWECPSCDVLNYRRNMICRKCSVEHPKQQISAQYEEHLWESPR